MLQQQLTGAPLLVESRGGVRTSNSQTHHTTALLPPASSLPPLSQAARPRRARRPRRLLGPVSREKRFAARKESQMRTESARQNVLDSCSLSFWWCPPRPPQPLPTRSPRRPIPPFPRQSHHSHDRGPQGEKGGRDGRRTRESVVSGERASSASAIAQAGRERRCRGA